MSYFDVKAMVLTSQTVGIYGSGITEFWLVQTTPQGLLRYVIRAMSASDALVIAEQCIGTPLVRFDTLADGNIKVEFAGLNMNDWYLFTGWN